MGRSRIDEPLISYEEQARRKKIEEEKEAKKIADHQQQYVMPLKLPLAQKIALLWMRTESKVAKAVLAAIDDLRDAPRPGWREFAALVDGAWATRENSNRHRLTPSGEHAADMVAGDLCKQLGVHLQIELGDDRYTCMMACSCGETFSFSKNQGHIASQKMRAWSRHIDNANQRRTVTDLFSKATATTQVASPPLQPEG